MYGMAGIRGSRAGIHGYRHVTDNISGNSFLVLVQMLTINLKSLNMKKSIVYWLCLSAIVFIPSCTGGGEDEDIDVPKEEEKNETDIFPTDPTPEWADIPAGTFMMGCSGDGNDCYDWELPLHEVTIGAFKMSKKEITNAQYAIFLNKVGVKEDGKYTMETYGEVELLVEDEYGMYYETKQQKWLPVSTLYNHPTVGVSWYGAKAFCNYYGYRLPTEDEWEYAARGGQNFKYPGSGNITEIGWVETGRTQKVGTKKANGYGLYDMCGNVSEWTDSWDTRSYSEEDMANPDKTMRIHRGGHIMTFETELYLWRRHSQLPSGMYYMELIGFRPCK